MNLKTSEMVCELTFSTTIELSEKKNTQLKKKNIVSLIQLQN